MDIQGREAHRPAATKQAYASAYSQVPYTDSAGLSCPVRQPLLGTVHRPRGPVPRKRVSWVWAAQWHEFLSRFVAWGDRHSPHGDRPAGWVKNWVWMKKITPLLKAAVLVAIVTWLVWDVRRNHPSTFGELRDHPKDWGQLILAVLMCLLAVSASFYRWYLLVRALDIPFHIRDAVRLGFLGYLFNFVALGSTGGDLVKALLVAREQRGRRLEAVSTIVLDRLIGFYGLLLVASTAILCVGLSRLGGALRLAASCTLLLTGVGALLMVVLALVPEFAGQRVTTMFARFSRVGRPIQRLILAFQMYRRQKRLLVLVGVVSVAVHVSITVSVYFAARAIYADVPTLTDHFLICPLANVVGSLPISPSGLGTFELAMGYLYDHVPASRPSDGIDPKGLVVALSFRLIQVGVACVGVVFYWLNRRQVAEVLMEPEKPTGVI